MTATPYGPYETERDTYPAPLLLEAGATSAGRGRHQPVNERHLLAVCADANVDLGAYDRRIITWLAGWEPQTVQVVIGLIGRAYEAGRVAG